MKKPSPLPVWVLSLGCAKNRVDTERLLGQLGNVRPVQSIGRSKLALINTCGFIEPAVRESVRAILDAAAEIADNKRRPLLAVAGCMVGRYGMRELAKEMPEVDLWLPTEKMLLWPQMLQQALGRSSEQAGSRIISTPKSYAWLKIAEGCGHDCAFCIIPKIRGPLVSTPSDLLLEEARQIAATGVRELDLIAQDCAAYGRDLGGDESLPDLLRKLSAIDGFAWIRLLYLYPGGINRNLLETMKALAPKVLPYLDIPLQHSHPDVLGSMGRPFALDARRVIDSARAALPDCALRTTIIVGYPGETEEHFEHLCRFIEETRFTHLGIFTYFAEEGTKAAQLENQVPDEIKKQRKARLAAIQAGISREYLESYLGTAQTALVDAPNPEWPNLYDARLWFQAPEVDGLTYLSCENCGPGDMVECSIEDAGDYDLSALGA